MPINRNVPKGLTKYLTMLHQELSSHMMKEEQILFPMIKQGMGAQAGGPISVMESEHDEAGELLEVIKHITHNVTPPPEACTTWKAMYNGINEMIDDLMEHISLENNVLFRAPRRKVKKKAPAGALDIVRLIWPLRVAFFMTGRCKQR
ncbi:nitric oxide-dependent regulator DnrN or NorA [Klebsiella pneumoniae]|uniref:Nitric oxide-dependent regulator DnrN or NorA n=1 Tax=Klebsiella pneumoniae TaxID=573 RepID=A0A377XS07_KLEPN|nr:nitric oxide-dependent regulator DnrN or NorA [Klebsiella pneumoniae]